MKSRNRRNASPLTRGQWAVMRERCRLEDATPGPLDPGGSAVGEVVLGLVKKLGIKERHGLACLMDEWQALVGDAVALHTRPGGLEDGDLTVYVDGSVWLSELRRYGWRPMLANLQKRFKRSLIQSVRFQMDPDGPSR